MGLQEIIDELVASTPGAVAAILADWEGEAVVTATRNGGDYEIKFIGAHHGLLLDRTLELTRRLGIGRPRELCFVHDGFNILTAPVNRDYYLVLTLEAKVHPLLVRPRFYDAVRQISEDIG